MPHILYTGVGAKDDGIHSIEEFLTVMKLAPFYYHEMSSRGYDMEYKHYLLPEDFPKFTLEVWLDYTGAEYQEDNI